MAVGINNALFQTGQNHINRKAKKDKALQKDNVQIRGSKQVSGKQNYSKSDEVSDDAVSTYADITTKNGIGISVKSDNGIANTYKTKDDGVMLQLSDDSDIVIEDDSVSGDKSSQKTKKEEEYEKFQKQLENLKDMLERMKETKKTAAKTETKTKKVLNYSYKKVSSSIQGAKSISQASNAVASANSNLSNQSSETLVFSRKIGILILVPYVFSLVFALMSRNKGNFLFRLPRPPYQAVLRKFVSLPS